jgi:hypothetical protein
VASFANLLNVAEQAKLSGDFETAISVLRRMIDLQIKSQPEGKPDVFLAQQLALATYKAGEKGEGGDPSDPDVAMSALYQAEDILETYCAPSITNDPETLGLAGAINKRLFDLTDDLEFLNRAIRFYERGFYIKQDYYNGINVAFMYSLRATRMDNQFDAIVSFGHANMIREQVARICEEIIADEQGFANRGDREWVLLTLAEAYHGMGRTPDAQRVERKADAHASRFAKQSYQKQKSKLLEIREGFDGLVEAAGQPASAGVAKTQVDAKGQISFKPEIASGKAVRSLEVTYKIEYD